MPNVRRQKFVKMIEQSKDRMPKYHRQKFVKKNILCQKFISKRKWKDRAETKDGTPNDRMQKFVKKKKKRAFVLNDILFTIASFNGLFRLRT